MSQRLSVITGATGLVGSHIAEQLRGGGERVRALVRRGSDTAFLQSIGVELTEGDLLDPDSVARAVEGADVVYHCAARVSNWGPWSEFERDTATPANNVVAACRRAGQPRLVHVSSISVYGHPTIRPGDSVAEDAPLGQNYWVWDYYARSKVLAEEVARTYAPLTIVRPSWIYGPRDRITIPRLVPALLGRRVPIIGPGDNFLNLIYAGDVAAGAILAAHHAGAVGQAYNLCSEGEVTQLDMLNAMCDALGIPRITRRVPFGLALRFAFLKEAFAKLLRRREPPTVTRFIVYLVGRRTQYSIDKARRELGWRPHMNIQEGLHRSLTWFHQVAPDVLPSLTLPVLATK
ncbi:MAG: NAD-dependent epimerase/dehydratase family protein [Gemmataceae bacterium]|nr:NAD-dependent epimerase/dehydratase family protein [Gemmataceae bacterium]